MERNKTLFSLFWPCFFEILFMMLAGMIDTFMLSALNDKAVGAVGTANAYLSILLMMFSIISSGMAAVMTQYIGASKEYIAKRARNIALILNTVLGLILSLILGLGSKQILVLIGISPALLEYATTYMCIIGGTSFLIAIIPIFSCYLRSFGYTKPPMYATIIGNTLNLLLNAIFLFVLDMGVAGVALATVISRIINLIIVMLCSHIYIKVNTDNTKANTKNNNEEIITNKTILKQIIKIGLPAAAESALYELTMTIIIKFLNDMDQEGINVTARSYVATITNFSYTVGAALAQSNCILLGWNIGKRDYKKCYNDTARALKYGIISASILSIGLFLLAKPLLGLFTSNSTIINIATKLLFIDIFLELGRVTNLIFANALKTTGDALFIVIIASIVMLVIGAGGTYILGIHMGFLVVGSYVCMALDEILRGIISVKRFFSKKWEAKTLV